MFLPVLVALLQDCVICDFYGLSAGRMGLVGLQCSHAYTPLSQKPLPTVLWQAASHSAGAEPKAYCVEEGVGELHFLKVCIS